MTLPPPPSLAHLPSGHQPPNQAMVSIPMGLNLKHSLKEMKDEAGTVVGITGQGSLQLSAIEVTHSRAYL